MEAELITLEYILNMGGLGMITGLILYFFAIFTEV